MTNHFASEQLTNELKRPDKNGFECGGMGGRQCTFSTKMGTLQGVPYDDVGGL